MICTSIQGHLPRLIPNVQQLLALPHHVLSLMLGKKQKLIVRLLRAKVFILWEYRTNKALLMHHLQLLTARTQPKSLLSVLAIKLLKSTTANTVKVHSLRLPQQLPRQAKRPSKAHHPLPPPLKPVPTHCSLQRLFGQQGTT